MKKTRGAGPKYHARRLAKLYERQRKIQEVRVGLNRRTAATDAGAARVATTLAARNFKEHTK